MYINDTQQVASQIPPLLWPLLNFSILQILKYVTCERNPATKFWKNNCIGLGKKRLYFRWNINLILQRSSWKKGLRFQGSKYL